MADIESPPAGLRAGKKCQADASDELSLVRAIAGKAETALQDQLFLRYRRPLMQVFHHRRIDRDAAGDLLQRTFEQGIKKIHADGLADPSNLGGYLYRTACKLATAYWRGELSHEYVRDSETLDNLVDGALSLEERVEREQLSQWVRELVEHLPHPRDREVLVRFYLDDEPRTSISRSLKLSELQFNQVLWRARQRFGDILRRHGVDTNVTGTGPV